MKRDAKLQRELRDQECSQLVELRDLPPKNEQKGGKGRAQGTVPKSLHDFLKRESLPIER